VHPLIRVICFLVFSTWLALGGPNRLWCAAALILIAYAVVPAASLRAALTMSRRLRWFFLSLLIIYGWFTPGMPLWDAIGTPSVEGLSAGFARVLALVLIVFAVNLLLRSSSREELLTAIYSLAYPLTLFGLSHERLALRVILVMEALDQTRERVTQALSTRPQGKISPRGIGLFMSTLLSSVIAHAETRPRQEFHLSFEASPPVLQWCYPVLLSLTLYAAGRLVLPFAFW
jgi:energy-coupling factor transport system permease protein